jgi:hypothetical protein
MKNKLFTIACGLGVCVAFTSCAQSKNTIKAGSKYAVHLESLTERTLPGRQETEPATDVYHIIIWKSTQAPEVFYWKDGSVWTSCNISKVSATKKKLTGALKYTTEDIRIEKVKKGDTLQLTANSPEGKYKLPDEVPATAKSTIFFKTAKTKWLPIPVKKYRKLPDVIMP